jgi:hypothetical protein
MVVLESLAAISQIAQSIPLVNNLWQRFMERQLEVTVKGPTFSQTGLPAREPAFVVQVGQFKSLNILCDLVLTNHRTSRKERIISAEVHMKKRHWLFWKKTIFHVPLDRYACERRDPYPFNNVELEPMSAPIAITVTVSAALPENVVRDLPRRFDLVVEFKLVGPIQKTERIIHSMKHDARKIAADIGGSQV